jgi:hypothetical protein
LFQGPVLEKLWVFNFRVTFPERTSHLITPEAYHSLEQLPELIDTGISTRSSENGDGGGNDGVVC